jgi:hypothetical protein
VLSLNRTKPLSPGFVKSKRRLEDRPDSIAKIDWIMECPVYPGVVEGYAGKLVTDRQRKGHWLPAFSTSRGYAASWPVQSFNVLSICGPCCAITMAYAQKRLEPGGRPFKNHLILEHGNRVKCCPKSQLLAGMASEWFLERLEAIALARSRAS